MRREEDGDGGDEGEDNVDVVDVGDGGGKKSDCDRLQQLLPEQEEDMVPVV